MHAGALERVPNIRWVLAHAGGTVPYLVSRFSLLWAIDEALAERAPQGAEAYLGRLHDDSALSANPHALSSLAQLVGWDHVVFGSDYPLAPEVVTQLSTMVFDADDRSLRPTSPPSAAATSSPYSHASPAAEHP